ncbi:DZI1L protein, partial [Cochlearius cochlearius]|nr:DZI1L protein [Cochlearius cochlearius]
MPGSSPGLAVPAAIPPFHFQPLRVGVDWRRFSAVDVERVAREVDVAALQEHIAAVTFCHLDGERCPHCRQPADPVLLKVLRMAQLSLEYLLHCQQVLGTSLALHAQHLRAARAELACTQQQAAGRAAQLQGAKEESRRWKKLVATQQLLLRAGPNAYCKVRFPPHPPPPELPVRAGRSHPCSQHLCFPRALAERQRMEQVEQMEAEVEELKAKLRETQQRLEAEREAEKRRREQETERARQREEGRSNLERWKEEERMKLHEEIDGLRQLFLAAFEDVASRSSAMEGKLQELQAREAAISNLGTLRNDDTEEARSQTPRRAELRGERERMAARVSSGYIVGSSPEGQQRAYCPLTSSSWWPWWASTLGFPSGLFSEGWCQTWASHGSPKGQVHPCFLCRKTRWRSALASALGPLLLCPSQALFSPAVTREVTRAVADAESSAPSFTPDREEAALGGKRRLLEALRKSPNLLKQFRPILEEALEEKLESMGVKRVAKGISTRTYRNLQVLVRLQQQQKAEKFPGLLRLRDELVRAVVRKVRRCKKPGATLPRRLSIIPGELIS